MQVSECDVRERPRKRLGRDGIGKHVRGTLPAAQCPAVHGQVGAQDVHGVGGHPVRQLVDDCGEPAGVLAVVLIGIERHQVVGCDDRPLRQKR